MNYTVGVNPRNSSYITNWGSNPPQHPHHRANEPNRDGVTNGMHGALVGGPNNSDGYVDDVNDYYLNEVAIDYNASFILGMAGKIYYEYNTPPQPNVPPTVSITSPSSGSSVDQGATITLSANASDSDGNVELVEFLVGGSKVGEDASSPYSISWTVPLAGNYAISARAIDDRNGSATSSEVSITAVSNIPDPTTPNLALNQPTNASSVENSGLPASNAVDGNYGSRWSSAFSDPQWIYVDLGSSVVINRVILNWEAAAGKVYDIQVSNNASSWQTVAAITGGNGGEDDIVFADVSARYVRMYGTERTTPYGYSLFEFEVYGSEGDINIPPTAVISANPTSGYLPLTVSLDASGSTDPDGTIVSYSWDFGDGTTTSGISASKTYTTADTYTVSLTVTDDEGATSTATTNIVVSEPDECADNNTPNASFTYSLSSTEVPATINVDASSSSDPDYDALTYSWSFGNGNSATGVTAQNTYTSAGDYNITLTVVDVCGSTSTQNLTITLTAPDECQDNSAPTASFTLIQPAVVAPSAVAVDASASSDPDGDALTYSWTFGDGNSASGVTADNTYTSAGTYTVTLTVTDICANSDSDQQSVTVEPGSTPCESPSSETMPFSFDGAGEYCWFLTGSVAYVNSWNMGTVEINGVDYTNTWSNSMPATIDGGYYVYYNGQYPWSHFEMVDLKSAPADMAGQNGVLVYPNPFDSKANLVIKNPEQVTGIEIMDQTGKMITRINKSEIDYQLTIGNQFAAGVYFIRILKYSDIQGLIIIKN